MRSRLLMRRKPGDLLNPGWLTADEVEKLRAGLPPHIFAALLVSRYPSARDPVIVLLAENPQKRRSKAMRVRESLRPKD